MLHRLIEAIPSNAMTIRNPILDSTDHSLFIDRYQPSCRSLKQDQHLVIC